MFYKYIKERNNNLPNPIWIMRQAGRYLPEYRAIRKNYSNFLEFCYSVEDAAEVTLQPIKRYNLDAAIIFSDILVILDALGHKVEFKESVGPIVSYDQNIQKVINKDKYNNHLKPVYTALKLVRAKLHSDKSLIGFVGGVFTLLAYLIDGSPSKNYAKAISFIRNNNEEYMSLKKVLIVNG